MTEKELAKAQCDLHKSATTLRLERRIAELEDECTSLVGGIMDIADERDQAQAERDRYRAALDLYGRHMANCTKQCGPGELQRPCSCGFDDALKGDK